VAACLFLVDGQDVQRWLGLQAPDDPQPEALAAPDDAVGEDAGVVVAAGDDVQVQLLPSAARQAVVDPAWPPAAADALLDELNRCCTPARISEVRG
jgi:hypothetical protein